MNENDGCLNAFLGYVLLMVLGIAVLGVWGIAEELSEQGSPPAARRVTPTPASHVEERLPEPAEVAVKGSGELPVVPNELPQAHTPTIPTPTPVASPQHPAQRCHPSYLDVCIPVGAIDADCDSRFADGPIVVTRPTRVRNADPYGLDADGDGWGCEPWP